MRYLPLGYDASLHSAESIQSWEDSMQKEWWEIQGSNLMVFTFTYIFHVSITQKKCLGLWALSKELELLGYSRGTHKYSINKTKISWEYLWSKVNNLLILCITHWQPVFGLLSGVFNTTEQNLSFFSNTGLKNICTEVSFEYSLWV